MMTATQCLAKADEMDERATTCGDREATCAFKAIALHWRHAAVLARQQEAWTVGQTDAQHCG